MQRSSLRALALAIASAYALPIYAADVLANAPSTAPDVPRTDAPPETIQVAAKRLNKARGELSPETGSTVYRFSSGDVDKLPLGDNTALNQVLLQAPGVVQDSYGQLHVRGDHGNVQYRINGVIIPEAMTGFGQSLDTRFIDQINFLTGALPAQYGYRTAGVVDIHTKGSDLSPGGDISTVVGSNGYRLGSAEYGGSTGAWNYYLSGGYLQDDLGIENPIPTRNAIHDKTTQAKSFGYVSRVLDDNSRLSFMFGVTNNSFQIPNVPGQVQTYPIGLPPTLNSANLDAHQNEQNQFQVVSYQASPNKQFDYQVSLFHRMSDVHYYPDALGDLDFNGVAATIFRKIDSTGIQADSSYKINPAHTLRSGVFLEQERFGVDSSSSVYLTDNSGTPINYTPTSIPDATRLAGGTYGVYVQDEWQPYKTLTINYGARFDKTNTVTHEQQLSPRLGVVYDLTTDTRIHAGYARYFTPPPTEIISPATFQLFQNTTNAQSTNANTAVLAERSNYFDLGFTQNLTRDWNFGVDAYYRQVKNLQDEGQFGAALIYSAFNYAEGRIRGIELTSTYKHGNLSSYLNVARSQALASNVITGQQNFGADELAYLANNWIHVDHDQKLETSAGASYRLANVTLGGDVLYGSGLRRGFANTAHLPSYTQVNLSANKTIDSESYGRFAVRLAVLNVFDKVYELRDGTGVGVGAPQYGPRRGLFLGLDKSF
jgi:outer membrane receptor protein involved in Fe transport